MKEGLLFCGWVGREVREKWCRDLSGSQQERPNNKRLNETPVSVRETIKRKTDSKPYVPSDAGYPTPVQHQMDPRWISPAACCASFILGEVPPSSHAAVALVLCNKREHKSSPDRLQYYLRRNTYQHNSLLQAPTAPTHANTAASVQGPADTACSRSQTPQRLHPLQGSQHRRLTQVVVL